MTQSFDERTNLENLRTENMKAQDKVVLALSSGVLALSLVVYEKISAGIFLECLATSWILLSLCLLVNLLSYSLGTESLDRQIWYIPEKNKPQDDNLPKYEHLRTLTEWSNYLALSLLCWGIVFFLIFAISNLMTKG